jgi:signal transduction histidine kinase
MAPLSHRKNRLPAVWIVLIPLFCISVPGLSQSNEVYIQELKKSTNAAHFDSIFLEMMKSFKEGKLQPFQDEEVMAIIDAVKVKPFAEVVLPGVYGWAGTMFGNGRMEQALVYFMESAELYGKQNKKLAQALACFEIALIQHKAENYEEAETSYRRALDLGSDSLNHRIKINCINGFALIERTRKNFAAAELEFKNAYDVADANHDSIWMGILAGNIGSIYMARGNYDSSLYYYFRNLYFVKNTLEFENEIETYAHLGKLYLLKSDLKLAKAYLDSAVGIIRNRKIHFNDFFNPMDYINESYAQLYAAGGDYQQAFEHYTKFHEVSQQKLSNLNGLSLKQLESTYAFNQKNNELELLKKINQANVLAIQQQRYIAAAFAIIILLMLVWAINAHKTGLQRRRLNKELSESNAELERLNRVKDKLFSVLSHDLRSPIASLKTLVSYLQDDDIEKGQLKKLYSQLHHQLEMSGQVLESLLQWTKNELVETRLHLDKVVLASVADNVALQLKNAMDEKNIQFHNNLNFHLTALADKFQVEIILRNLIANAVKFTNQGGSISVAGKSNGKHIEVHVEDNGMGMHEEEIKNLFQPGKLFTNKGTNQEKGTGIGLFITKEMVLKNGGNIWVNSRKEEGTVFTFTLPWAS